MAWGIVTTKSDDPPNGVFGSRIARWMLLGNLLGLAILVAGGLVLSEVRRQVIDARLESLAAQGEIYAAVLAETATQEGGGPDGGPVLLPRQAALVLQRITTPSTVRLRVSSETGEPLADTDVISDRVIEQPLPEFRLDNGSPGAGWRILPWRPNFTREEEIALALLGQRVAGQRLGDDGQRVVSASLPIKRVEKVVGVLTLEAEGVDAMLAAERWAMAPYVTAAAVVISLTSFLLAIFIARPLRRLAQAADSLRTSGATRLVLPEVARRGDEIGDLAKALERMTAALADRIDANERFAADVAHEIKNPLTSIRSAVETTRSVHDAATRERLLAIIAADVTRLDRLITDIARASSLEAETARGTVQPIDLGQLISELTEIYAMTRREGEPMVTFRGPAPPDAVVLGQDGPLGQVFRNLIDNAKSFSPAGGLVSVLVETERRREAKWVRVTVSDQGPGVPPENLEAIFARFYTDRPKGAAFGGNSGLGLSIARQIVEAHKGRIWAENIPGLQDGQRLGARLIVELPAAG